MPVGRGGNWAPSSRMPPGRSGPGGGASTRQDRSPEFNPADSQRSAVQAPPEAQQQQQGPALSQGEGGLHPQVPGYGWGRGMYGVGSCTTAARPAPRTDVKGREVSS